MTTDVPRSRMNAILLGRPPFVLRRRRVTEISFAIAGAVVMIAGMAFATREHFRFVGLPLGGVGLFVFLFGILQVVRPPKLMLEPAGLHYSILGIHRSWPWQTVSSFRVAHIRSGEAIVFDVAYPDRSGTFAIPAFFSMRPGPLADLLNDARSQWIDENYTRGAHASAVGASPSVD
ncbi:hypothetical protein NDN01_18155 [Sphingomonas sp. QA11]|uniref:hypothetical protein n=1 Tax=Sphingomonas sp. QA11 TaxID=2950605 RepID=UPI00234B443E|nr:hypothetical protein [Sphingomonas sp. QA11]WCM25934.1 hypothetical protein NDN01_18155 [Sphingomonas sp. QA11]